MVTDTLKPFDSFLAARADGFSIYFIDHSPAPCGADIIMEILPDLNRNHQQSKPKYSDLAPFKILDYLPRLQIVKETSTEYHCQCPCCGDGGFKINKATGKYQAFKCGCKVPEIREKIRPWSEVIEELPAEGKITRPKQYREWIYRDRQGNLLVKVCRFDDGHGQKIIWQEHWDGSQWQKGYGDVIREDIPVYNYQQVKEAIVRGEPVFVVEGEVCAEALIELGMAATTNIGGAGKWLEHHTKDLAGAKLIIFCPDRDRPGVEHMKAIGSNLPPSTEVKWLCSFPSSPLWKQLPSNGGLDLVDWIQTGASLEEILNGIESTPKIFAEASQAHNHRLKEQPQLSASISMEEAAQRARVILLKGGSELSINFELERLRKLTSLSCSFWERKVIAPLKRELEGDRFKADLMLLLQKEDRVEQARQIAQLASRYQMSSGTINKTLDIMRSQIVTPKVEALTLNELFELESTGLDWLVPEFIPQGETVILSAAPKTGKTLLAIDIAFVVATGEDTILGQAVPGGKKVLIVECDESLQSTKSKLLKRGFRKRDAELVRVLTSWNISQLVQLEAHLEDFRPDLVIIDSIRRINHGSPISENSAEFADRIYTLKETLQRYGASGLLIHHSNKNHDALGVNKLRGSSAIAGAVWGTMTLDHIPQPDPHNQKKTIIDPRNLKRILNLHARDSEGQSLEIKLNPENCSWSVTSEVGVDEAVAAERKSIGQRILNVLTINPQGLGGRDIITALNDPNLNTSSVYTTLNRLVNKKMVSSKPASGDRRYTIYYLVASQPQIEYKTSNEEKLNTPSESYDPPPPPFSVPNVIHSSQINTLYSLEDRQQYITLDNKIDNTQNSRLFQNPLHPYNQRNTEIDNQIDNIPQKEGGGVVLSTSNHIESLDDRDVLVVDENKKLRVGDRVVVKSKKVEGNVVQIDRESSLLLVNSSDWNQPIWFGWRDLEKLLV